MVALGIPDDEIRLETRSVMLGEELMLRGLYELVSGNDQNDCIILFGRDQTQQSRAFTWFINHINGHSIFKT